MTCFLETGPFSNRKNAESLPNLPPPQKKGGGVKRGFVSDPLPKKRSAGGTTVFSILRYFQLYKIEARGVLLEPDPFQWEIKRGDETGVESSPFFT